MFPIPFNIKCLFFIKAFKDIYNSDLLQNNTSVSLFSHLT